MKCLPNCGKCCGLIPLPEKIWEKNQDKVQAEVIKLNKLSTNKVLAVTNDLLCVFLNRKTKNCEIYSERPRICRNYSASECLEWKDYPKKV